MASAWRGARGGQLRRLAGTGAYANAHMTPRQVRRLCRLAPEAMELLDRAYERLRLSARACDRVVKVAQTIADLEGAAHGRRRGTSGEASRIALGWAGWAELATCRPRKSSAPSSARR